MSEMQLDLLADLGECPIHLQPSKDGALGLKRFINRGRGCGAAIVPAVSSTFLVGKGLQGSFPFNLIYLDHGVSLAANGRWTKHDLSVGHDAQYLLEELLGELEIHLNQKRFSRKKYLPALDIVLANLLRVHLLDGQLIIRMGTNHEIYERRNPERVSSRTLQNVIMFLAECDYIALQVGRSNEYQGNASWCIPLANLIGRLEQSKARVMLRENACLAELRERPKKRRSQSGRIDKIKGDPIHVSHSSREWNRLKNLEKPARAHNTTWLNYIATLDGKVVIPWLRRIFIESTQLGGRFYGEYQNLPSELRDAILINGEKTVELDFKAMHIAILYALEGIELDGDPYHVEGYPREAIKSVCLVLANTDNLPALKAAITRSAQPEIQRVNAQYQVRRYEYERLTAINLKCDKPKMPVTLEGYVDGLPKNCKGQDVIYAIRARHTPIAHHFGQEDIGLRLQRLDSDVMAAALTMLKGIPVLPVHDSIRCRVSDINTVYEVMAQACIKVLGHRIRIEEK